MAKKKGKASKPKVGDWDLDVFLYFLGAIISIIIAIVDLINPTRSWGGLWAAFIFAPLAIFLALIVLVVHDIVKIPKLKLVKKEWIVFLIFGLIIFIPTWNFGGLVIAVTAILQATIWK